MPTVLLRSEETAGVVSMIELSSDAGFAGPPLHRHDFDEAFYVLEGELTFQLGDELSTAGPGSLTWAPRGSVHTFANLADAPARYLLICTPGGFERMFARIVAERAGEEPDEDALRPYPETTMVGPTLFEKLGGR
jgi:quercetin dioxygenase-like cupin family protein